MNVESARRMQTALDLAGRASEILMRHFRRLQAEQVVFKGRRDLVTPADLESETFLTRSLRDLYPEDGILAEESGADHAGRGPWLWVLDPLDGTTNFVHGFPHFAVSIGLWREGRPILGVVRDPCLCETYAGLVGEGASRDGRSIAVSKVPQVRAALLCTGFAYGRNEPGAETNLERFGRALMACQGIRRTGCASLDFCYLAAGALDGFWELGLAPHDLGAGVPIVLAAGGTVTDLAGEGAYFHSGKLAASNGLIHPELLSLVGDRRTAAL